MGIVFSWFTRTEVADEAQASLPTPSSFAYDNPFRLLDLPPELVDRIASFAGSDALLSLRLSCKALEAITFDQFATENFEHIYCWVARTYHFRGLKDILDHSPRISGRIRYLTLAANIFDYPQLMAPEVVRPVRVQRVRGGLVPANAAQASFLPDIYCIGLLTVLRALQGVHRLPQEVSVTVNLANMSHADYEHGHLHHPQQAIMFAVATSHLNIHSVTLDGYAFDNCDDLLAYDRANLIASMSTLEIFELVDEIIGTTGSQLCIDILEDASRLRQLGFHPGLRYCKSCQLAPLPPELLLANNLSTITDLRITAAVIDTDSLVHALARCQKSLVNMVMSYVALSTNDGDWAKIVHAMLAMPELSRVELLLIQAAPVEGRRFFRFHLPNNFTYPKSKIFEGRERVVEGLQSLLDNHMYL